MAAYAAVISLKNTIECILHSSLLSLVDPSNKIMQLAYKELQPLREILERLDSTSKGKSRKEVNALDGQIKEAVRKFEDLLESFLSDRVIPQSESYQDRLELTSKIHRRRRRLRKEVDSFVQTLKDMEKIYIYALHNMPEDDDDDGESISSRIGYGGAMIGLSDQFEKVKSFLMREYRRKHAYALFGMAGIGKTTLAKKIFQDPEILRRFDHRAWVTVGRKSQLRDVLRGIRAQLDPNSTQGDERFGDCLKSRLEAKKCLIVVDDVWDARISDSVITSLPEIHNGRIQILLTSRDRCVIRNISDICSYYFKVLRLLNEEESKELLCEKVFGEKNFPPRLEKAGKKIAKNCEGLPLMIVTVAHHLSQANDTSQEYWEDVAEQRNSVFTEAYDEISKVLFPTYDYLPQHLKMFFLYLGVFPQDYEIPPSKIINMLTAEGWFLDTNNKGSLEESVWMCLDELCAYHNLVLYSVKSTLWYARSGRFVYKTCRLHSTWQHLCRGEARKNKFYHVLNRLVDASEQDMKGQRCLCLHNNILFSIKEFFNSVKCNCASSTRSLLFFGPYHQYPIPIGVSFKFLRELDALKLRFYTFPIEILKLVQLKYLALTCNGKLPSTISKLSGLRVLIIRPHMSIKCGAPSYIPKQIWDMQELEHIEILGKSFGAVNRVASLEKLSTLVGANVDICTILELFKGIPNAKKLGVQIEMTPYDDYKNLLNCFRHISTLESLKTLKCSIIKSLAKCDYVAPRPPRSLILPHGLKKLHLSGMGFPWEYMDVVGSLPFLQVLKLRSYAFRGSKWEILRRSFLRLEFLLIEDTDLVRWEPKPDSFPKLSYLSMKHCYKLKELRWPSNSDRGMIELVDCNPLAFACAKESQSKVFTRIVLTATLLTSN